MANTNPKPLPVLSEKDIARFWAKVDKRGPDECWPWTAGGNDHGYGQFCLAGKKHGTTLSAHRIAYFLHYGKDPAPLFACHKCDNPPCCNGAHLFRGTNAQNTADRVMKNRTASGNRNFARLHPERMPRGDQNGARLHPETRARGELHGMSTITEDQVREIRRMHAEGWLKRPLARWFGVSPTLIYSVVLRKTWKHVA